MLEKKDFGHLKSGHPNHIFTNAHLKLKIQLHKSLVIQRVGALGLQNIFWFPVLQQEKFLNFPSEM